MTSQHDNEKKKRKKKRPPPPPPEKVGSEGNPEDHHGAEDFDPHVHKGEYHDIGPESFDPHVASK